VIVWLDVLIQGLLLGGLYALYAAGLALMFGVMRLVNIAHGDAVVAAAFVAIALQTAVGVGTSAALVIVPIVFFALGYALQRWLLNLTLGRGILPPLLVTFGLSVVAQNLLLEIFSADSWSFNAAGLETLSLALGGGVAVGVLPLGILIAAILTTVALEHVLRRTRLGMAFRAASDDLEAAQLVGLDHRRLYALATAIAFAVIAIAGVSLAHRTTVAPTDGPNLLLYAFESVIIGGLGSFWGTFAGAATLGIAQAIGLRLDPGWGPLAGHLAFFAILLWRPTGLYERTHEWA